MEYENEEFQHLGPDLLCIFDSEEQIRSMKPDQSKLAGLPGREQNGRIAISGEATLVAVSEIVVKAVDHE